MQPQPTRRVVANIPHRFLGVLVVIALLMLAGPSVMPVGTSATAADATSPTATVPSTPGAGPCGGQTLAPKPDGTPWQCTFDDEFNASQLDRTKWVVDQTSSNGLHIGTGCLVDDPRTVSEGAGVLTLSTLDTGAPFLCDAPNSPFSTQYIAGSVNTYGHFAQKYGRFEIRARFPGTTVPGIQTSLWLFPAQPLASPYASVGDTGEIDIAEHYTQYPDLVIPYAHYVPLFSFSPRTNTTCRVVGPDQFHTYLLEWSPTLIRISYDGAPCLTMNRWFPLPPTSAPSPFDTPDLMALTHSVGVGKNAPTTGTPLPSSAQIDYVRVWK